MQNTREKPKTKRQLVADAREAAIDGRWDDAIQRNLEIVDRYPQDAEAQNRLGRAYSEFGRFGDSYESYVAALRIDPANLIARRNLQRLEHLRGRSEDDGGRQSTLPRTLVFIEEVGKTSVEELVNPASIEDLAEIAPGEQLQIEIDGQRLYVTDRNGHRVGEIQNKTAERVIELAAGGNRYEVYALGLAAGTLRVILREVYRDSSQALKVSFPGKIKATRAYLRERETLRLRDEAEFLLGDEDDDEDEEETLTETGEELESAEADTDSFID
jgi:tetratricopeptide (TPR) repeat protein